MRGAKQIYRIVVVAVLFCTGFIGVQAQIQGPNKVGNNTTYTYSYNDGSLFSGVYWTATQGAVINSWTTGTTYYVQVNWTNSGIGDISMYASDGLNASLSITITNCTTVSVPAVTGATRCNAGTFTLTATAGSGGTGIRWYHYYSSSPIIATGPSYTTGHLTTTTLYYATTFNTTTGCESSKVNVLATIATPTVAATAQSICSGTATSIAITNPNTIAGTTFRWTVVQSGTSGAASGSGATIAQTLTATGSTNGTATYTITPTANGCAGTAITVVATVKPKPTISATATQSIFSGNATSIAITNPNAVAGTTFSWTATQTNVSGATSSTGSAIAQTLTATTSGTAVYTIKPTANGCSGTATTSTITVTPKPIVISAGGNTITLGKVTLDAGAGFATYDWRNSTNTRVATTRTLSTSVKNTYTVTVTKAGVTGSTTSAPFVLAGQVDAVNMNYIVSTTLLAGNITTQAQVLDQPVDSVNQAIQYFDGLGRPIQTVVTQGSPLKQDIVQANVYDAFGREPIKYLPYVAAQTNGQYKANAVSSIQAFYNNNADKIEDDVTPYAVTVFERSPLNRVIKQGAPGAAWQPNASLTDFSDRVIKQNYTFNVANDVILFTYVEATPSVNHYVTSGTAPNPAYYPANTLGATKTYDEHNNEVIEYKDKEGKVVLKRALYKAGQYTSTYYIYDDFGKLRVVLPPEATKRLVTEYFPTTVTQTQKETFLAQWAFRYKYDYRLRMIEKQVPGASAVYMVYDLRDRLVMTQDGNQRTNKEWTTTKYDTLNRPVMTVIYTHSTTVDQPTMSSLISTSKFSESFNGVAATHGYTLNVFPTTNLKVLSVSYYDNYKFRKLISDSTNYMYSTQGIGPATVSNQTRSLPTGSRVNILNSTNYLWSISFYDHKNRVVQTITQNHVNGRDIVTNQLDFAGRVKKTKTTHVKDATTKTIARRFVYDHGSRVKEVYHTFDTQLEVLLARNEYNEIGQVVTKRTHSRNSGSTFVQNTDYRYNFRGWLKQINDMNTPEVGDLFSMELRYHAPTANGGTAQYNGNISEAVWSSAGYDKESYGYYYDSLNRLKEARYFNWASPWKNGRYNEIIGGVNAGGYDLNGNILKLKRYGKKDASTYGLMDDLAYTYTGNQLTRVDDAIAKNAVEDGFKESTKVANEYGVYDPNGSMTKDLNKDVNAISYNIMNLARKVYKSGADSIIYTYDASGRKLSQRVYGTQAKTTDYVGEFVYENNAIAFVTHEEGRIVADNSVGAPRPWEYQYFLKDHLGNVRVTFSEKKTTTEYKATLETATQTAEQSTFKGYKNRSPLSIFNRTAPGTYSQVLNGGNNNQVGLAKSFAVNPGDVVDLEVFAKYEAATSTGNNLSTLFNALASTFNLSTGGTIPLEGPQAYNSFNTLFGAGPYVGNTTPYEDNVAPKAYLNYILFDENFVLKDFGFDQISNSALQVGVSPITPADYLSLHVKVKQKGYLYIYVSNEQSVMTNVYFDDLKITYHTGVEQMNSYFGFGLAQSSNGFEKQSLINQPVGYNGKELQDELNLGWNDYGARMYMSDIGRWGAIDPKSEVYIALSPYNYVANNPLKNTDIDGGVIRDCEGNIIVTSTGQPNKITSYTISNMDNKDGTHTIGRIENTYNVVNIYADDGSPIEALQLKSSIYVVETFTSDNSIVDRKIDDVNDPTYESVSDCHGYTFVEGKLWIDDDKVNRLIDHDSYAIVQEGNSTIVIYKKNGVIVHSARRNANGKYDNDAGILTLETNKDLDQASRGFTDICKPSNVTFYRKTNYNRVMDTTLGTESNGVRTITRPNEIAQFLKILTQ